MKSPDYQISAEEKREKTEVNKKSKIASNVQDSRGKIIALIEGQKTGKIFWTELVAKIETAEDFLALFQNLGIKNNDWQSLQWMKEKGHWGLAAAITRNERFMKWKNFLRFMGLEILDWNAEVSKLKTRKDFLLFFLKRNINSDQWRSSRWLCENGLSSLYKAIVLHDLFRDKGWRGFLQFMGIESDVNWIEIVSKCSTYDEFLTLFKSLGIGQNGFNSHWLQENEFNSLYLAIRKDPRFGSWQGFQKFIGIYEKINWVEIFSNCLTKEDFLKAFSENGLTEEQWSNTGWLIKNGFSQIPRGIQRDPRFSKDGWRSFLSFMGIGKQNISQTVRTCETPTAFLAFFAKLGIEGDAWQKAYWLQKNGHSGLYQAIVKDDRFFTDGWNGFLIFMGIGAKITWPERVKKCQTRDDFLRMFHEIGVSGDNWRNSHWLGANGFGGTLQAITSDTRFIKGKWLSFLDFMDFEGKLADDEFQRISSLGLEESIALLQDDPLKLKRYLQFAHPELTDQEIDSLVTRSFKGLRDAQIESSEHRYLTWAEAITPPMLDDKPPYRTDENTVTIEGHAPNCTHVFISGAYTRRKKVNGDGSFSLTIPLKTGALNDIRIMSLDLKEEARSKQKSFRIQQEGEPDDVEALIDLLSAMGSEALRNIQRNPGRQKYLKECMEQSLIKKFGIRFHQGEEYIQKLIAKETTSATMRKMLQQVLRKFIKIRDMEIPGVTDGVHMFFQKYCIAEIRRRMEEGLPGVILANDPGTGKTRIVQGATADKHTTVITPNSVVPAWEEEAGKVLDGAEITALHGEHSSIRKQRLQTVQKARRLFNAPQHVYTNRDFLRATQDEERFKLLSDDETVVVEDEAHSRHNEQSEQTKGAKMLRSAFRILVSATPAKNSKTFRRMLAVLKPKDERFKSDAAFAKAFPDSDPQALKTLNLLKEDVTIRFRKEDVMETVDPKQSLSQQLHKLPAKTFLPEEEGAFTMSMDQAESIYDMFVDWEKWCEKNGKYIPDTDITREDKLRTANGFAKKHAMRQTINNPRFINSKAQDAKLKKTRALVEKFMKEGRKVVIFCAYEGQAQKYAQEFRAYNPAVYTGSTSKKKDATYQKGGTDASSNDWILDENGFPIPDENGEAMSALEYERITFQNASDRQIMIATYAAGAVGTTFTAGKAMIFDDCPEGCIDEIQAEDRIHRIDPSRMTHKDVKYAKLQSRYPDTFIKAVKNRWLVKENGHYKQFSDYKKAKKYADSEGLEVVNAYTQFFEQGTYDQVHTKNLRTQRTIFHLINDGIADDSALKEDQIRFAGLENGKKED